MNCYKNITHFYILLGGVKTPGAENDGCDSLDQRLIFVCWVV